jgi:hypothetical protein
VIGNGNALPYDRGKQRYLPVVEWADKHPADRFSLAVIAAVRAKHGPEALGPSA